MALIVAEYPIVILTEEKHLPKGINGWKAEGRNIFVRCARCGEIMRINRVPPSFHDGRSTCASCHKCHGLNIYVLAGLKSHKPQFGVGTFSLHATANPERRVIFMSEHGCPCGGTLIDMDAPQRMVAYCLSCLKKAE